MSTLYLIRHGQASFGADDYDVLSELGGEQSRALGRYLGARGVQLDAIYTGPRQRHLDTTLHVRAGAAVAGELPEPVVIDELDEYPAFQLFRRWLPELVKDDPSLAGALSSPPAAQRRTIQNALETIIGKWSRGELDTGDLETFQQFVARVEGAVARIRTEQGRGKSVAVVTSGGPVSVAVRMALDLVDEKTLKIAWVLANASVTEFRYRDDDLNLVAFNRIGHLDEQRLITYR